METIEHVIKAHILATLEKYEGKMRPTYKALGVSRATLYRYLRKFKKEAGKNVGTE